jgi:predicted DNA-binding protein with PD1-like motif
MIRFYSIGVDEEEEVLIEIKKIFKKHKLNIKVAHGTSYDFRPTI